MLDWALGAGLSVHHPVLPDLVLSDPPDSHTEMDTWTAATNKTIITASTIKATMNGSREYTSIFRCQAYRF